MSTVNAQRLDRFGADTGSETRNGIPHRIGYTDIKNYFGYIEPGAPADGIQEGKNIFFLYTYINDTLPEIGVRIITPLHETVSPNKGDFVSENYYENEKERTNSFNSWIALEYADNIKSQADISTNPKGILWDQLGFNDDSNELYNKTNSVLRIKSTTKKTLKPGLYRIVFSSAKEKEVVKGGFLIQLGSTISLPGVKLTSNIEEIQLK